MRSLAFPVTLACAVLSAFACGARSELLDELGGDLGAGNGGNGNDDLLPDGAVNNDAARFDDANDEASRGDSAPPNPCGGYQAYAAWPAFQRCSGHVGRTEAIGATNPTVKWAVQVGRPVGEEQGVLGPPTIAADGTIYAATLFGEVVALTPSGTTKWTAHPTFTQTGPSAVAVGADGSLYVELDKLYALNSTGSSEWTAPIAPGVGSVALGPTTSSVTLSQTGQLYLGTGKGLVGIASNGAVQWTVGSKEQGWTPAIDLSGVVYTGNDTGELIASHPDGTTLWTYDVPAPKSGGASAWIQAAPAIADDGTVYFGALSGFFAFSPSGALKWQVGWDSTPEPGSGASVAIGADGTVYVASPDATLRSITPAGVVNWTVPLGTPESPPVIDGNGIIYLLANSSDSGSEEATLFAVNPGGTVAWSLALPSPLPGVHQGGLAFGSDGTLYVAASPIDMMFAIGQ